MLEFLELSYKRFLAKTPKYFKIIQRVFLALGTLGSALAGIGEYNGYLPSWVLPTLLSVGCIGSFITQLTVEEPQNLS